MKKSFGIIWSQVKHSLSPILHNFWLKRNKINAIYEKKLIEEKEIPKLIESLRKTEINGANVTVPFKKTIIPYLDILSGDALRTQSVNTVSLSKGNLIGDNTDIDGFELSIKKINYDVSDKIVLILGAGGVVPSII